jgi:hypothetical protein
VCWTADSRSGNRRYLVVVRVVLFGIAFRREAEAAVLLFRFMSDQEPEMTPEETAELNSLRELIAGPPTINEFVASDTINHNG